MLYRQDTPPTDLLRKLVKTGKSNEIEITTSGDESSSRPPSLIITYPNNDHWASKINSNFGQYIQVYLKKTKIFLISYSYENLITTSDGDIAYNKNWKFLCSTNGKDWDIVDEHENDPILGKSYKTILPVKGKTFYSYFRILNTGRNYYYRGNSDISNTLTGTILYVRNLGLHGFIQTTITPNSYKFLNKVLNICFFMIICEKT